MSKLPRDSGPQLLLGRKRGVWPRSLLSGFVCSGQTLPLQRRRHSSGLPSLSVHGDKSVA